MRAAASLMDIAVPLAHSASMAARLRLTGRYGEREFTLADLPAALLAAAPDRLALTFEVSASGSPALELECTFTAARADSRLAPAERAHRLQEYLVRADIAGHLDYEARAEPMASTSADAGLGLALPDDLALPSGPWLALPLPLLDVAADLLRHAQAAGRALAYRVELAPRGADPATARSLVPAVAALATRGRQPALQEVPRRRDDAARRRRLDGARAPAVGQRGRRAGLARSAGDAAHPLGVAVPSRWLARARASRPASRRRGAARGRHPMRARSGLPRRRARAIAALAPGGAVRAGGQRHPCRRRLVRVPQLCPCRSRLRPAGGRAPDPGGAEGLVRHRDRAGHGLGRHARAAHPRRVRGGRLRLVELRAEPLVHARAEVRRSPRQDDRSGRGRSRGPGARACS